jgi:hypothetical protein
MARKRIIQLTTVAPFSSNAFFKDDTKFDTPPMRPRTRAKEKRIPHIVKNIPMDLIFSAMLPGIVVGIGRDRRIRRPLGLGPPPEVLFRNIQLSRNKNVAGKNLHPPQSQE